IPCSTWSGSSTHRETGSSCAFKRRIRCSIKKRRASFWRAWSRGRSAKLRTNAKPLAPLVMAILLTTACRQDMHDQPKYQPLERSAFFEDGRASRPILAGTIAQGQLRDDEQFYTGKSGDKPVTTFPFPVTQEVLARGRQRFNIYCSP